jgi:A/G-specific adenine glycosylase
MAGRVLYPRPDSQLHAPSSQAEWQPGDFSIAVLDWFDQHGRTDLPWQQQPTPYRVWVSEIMLQQTQVGVVVPYFQRFMAHFPDLASLAAADQNEVLHLWSGLGYYARARNLHRAAQRVVEQHNAHLPADIDSLQALPGIGRSTAAAILSLAFGQRHAILDGNCKRVLARCFGIEGWPGRASVLAELWHLAEILTPAERVNSFNQAMMDLGSTLCTRAAPVCGRCPLAQHCVGLRKGQPRAYPAPKPRRNNPLRHTRMLLVSDPSGALLLQRRPASGVWGGLWVPPELMPGQDVADWCRLHLGSGIARLEMLPIRRHTFSHFQLDIQPMAVWLSANTTRIADDGAQVWIDPANPGGLGLPAPIQRLLAEMAAMHHDKTGELNMTRMVNCVKLGREAEGLDRVPYPGDLGKRVFENVSKQAWADWLKHQTMLINENRLSPMDPKARKFLEEQMDSYFFGEGAALPEGYVPPKS